MISNISGQWLKITKHNRNTVKSEVKLHWFSVRDAIESSFKCTPSIASRTENQCNFTEDFTVFLLCFVIFSNWPLIFDIIKFVFTSLYRFLLKTFNFESIYSISFLESFPN